MRVLVLDESHPHLWMANVEVERLQAMCPRPVVLKLQSILESPREPLKDTETGLLK